MNKLSKIFTEQVYLIIYIIIVGIGLVTSVLILSSIISKTVSDSGNNNTMSLDVSKTLTDKINNLKTSDNTTESPALPSGRINPFSE